MTLIFATMTCGVGHMQGSNDEIGTGDDVNTEVDWLRLVDALLRDSVE